MSQKHWWEVYNQSSEKGVFIGKNGTAGLVRSKFVWRSLNALATEAGITEAATEKILDKYMKRDEVYSRTNKEGEQQYSYWERGEKAETKTKTADEVMADDQQVRVAGLSGNAPAKAPSAAPKP